MKKTKKQIIKILIDGLNFTTGVFCILYMWSATILFLYYRGNEEAALMCFWCGIIYILTLIILSYIEHKKEK